METLYDYIERNLSKVFGREEAEETLSKLNQEEYVKII